MVYAEFYQAQFDELKNNVIDGIKELVEQKGYEYENGLIVEFEGSNKPTVVFDASSCDCSGESESACLLVNEIGLDDKNNLFYSGRWVLTDDYDDCDEDGYIVAELYEGFIPLNVLHSLENVVNGLNG